MKFQMGEIHVNRRDAVLILRAKVPKPLDYLEWYSSMLGRVLDRETVEVNGSVTKSGKKIAARKRAYRKIAARQRAALKKLSGKNAVEVCTPSVLSASDTEAILNLGI
jgi:hypothetical protein